MSEPSGADSSSSDRPEGHYVVVARRYRPQTFEELIGQQHVASALINAIRTNRVGHAYLFTGARGVGKTSAARILAKCLNCVTGPTTTPCGECDACLGIASGEDVDVLEIDGASNRGIDEIRQLRSNVNIRPSRSRLKVYIIDEVHMLTVPAFNALLKTLEEPPEHVKFVFCTTDAEKIPITVLSRCQRFDFAPVQTASIIERLEQIVASEGLSAEREALELLARRAGGSMRDSQSLLEQLLSFCESHITTADVHQLLGTAKSGQIAKLAETVVQRDAPAALQAIDEAIREGVDPGQLAEQLLGYFRDLLAASVGCDANAMLYTGPADHEQLKKVGQQLGMKTSLAVAQILDETLTRLRTSTHVRTLLDMAIVQICYLEDLDGLAELIAELSDANTDNAPKSTGSTSRAASAPRASAKSAQKKSEPVTAEASAESAPIPDSGIRFSSENVDQIWRKALAELEDMTAEYAGTYDSVAISAPNQLVVRFKPEYTLHKEACQRPERKQRLERVIAELTGRTIRIDFELSQNTALPHAKPRPVQTRRQLMREIERHPFIQQAIEVFDAEVTDLRTPKDA